MRKYISILFVAALAVCSTSPAFGVNSVVVESKTVSPGATGVVIPIYLTNDVVVSDVIVPLVIREVTPGAFITSLGISYGDRLPELAGAPLEWVLAKSQYPEEDGTCALITPGGFATHSHNDGGPHPVDASPEGALFYRMALGTSLEPGTDVTGSLLLTVDVTATEGAFEIDTSCVDPNNHLRFGGAPLPSFTKGIITIESPDLEWESFYDGPDQHHDQGRAVAVDGDGNIYVGGGSMSEIPFECGLQEWHGETATETWDDPAGQLENGGSDYFVRFTAAETCTLREARFLFRCTGGLFEPTVRIRVYGSDGPVFGDRMYPDVARQGDNCLGHTSIDPWDVTCYPDWTTVDLTGLGPLVFGPGEEFFISTTRSPFSTSGDPATFYSDDGSPGYGRSGYYSLDAEEYVYFDEVGPDYGMFTEAFVCCGANPAYDFVTIKYDADGSEQWVNRYAGSAHHYDVVNDIVVDDAGYAYATGYADEIGSGVDVLTIKYRPDGDTSWVRLYSGDEDLTDVGYALAIDQAGNVYVAGRSYGALSADDVLTIKYNANGDLVWSQHFDGPVHEFDVGRAIALDGIGGVYVGGYGEDSYAESDFLIIKYDVNGTEQWVRFHDSPYGAQDQAFALDLDASGSVYVTGEVWDGTDASRMMVVKYDAFGAFQWNSGRVGYSDLYNRPVAIAVDDALGYVHIAGTAGRNSGDSDILSLTFFSNDGDLYDGAVHSSPTGGDDVASALVLDGEGNFYVTGYADADCVTLKYDKYNLRQATWLYGGPGGAFDAGKDIVMDAAGDIIVAGYCTNANGDEDYFTLKYGTGCDCPYQCDYDEDTFLTALDLGSLIDVLFAGRPEEQDPDCPASRGDFDGDLFPTALDLGNLIDHLFAGGPGPVDPCAP